jgi:hypothetical protein
LSFDEARQKWEVYLKSDEISLEQDAWGHLCYLRQDGVLQLMMEFERNSGVRAFRAAGKEEWSYIDPETDKKLYRKFWRDNNFSLKVQYAVDQFEEGED